MTSEDSQRFPPALVWLKNGISAVLRPLALTDGEALGEFYENVPRLDRRHYCPHLLDRQHGIANAAKALSPLEVVLVLALPEHQIGGYAWYRWPAADAEKSGFGICISRACQGQGAGRILMTQLLEIAKTVGPPVMHLTVQLANARAVKLYQEMGFTVVREQMSGAHCYGFPPEPEYAMERRVR